MHDGIDDVCFGRHDGFGIGGECRCPLLADLSFIVTEEGGFPQQADRQEIVDRSVFAAGKLSLPTSVARRLCPAAETGEQPVEITCRRRCGDAEPRDGMEQSFECGFGGFGNAGGEAAQADQLGRQVVCRDGAPCGIGRATLGGCPQRLSLVEPASRPIAEAVGDNSRPIDTRRGGGKVSDGWQRSRRWGEFAGSGQKGGDACRATAGVSRRESRCQIGVADCAGGDLRCVPRARHRHRHSGHSCQSGGNVRQILIRLAEERIDGDCCRQWPRGWDGVGGRSGSGAQIGGHRCAGHAESLFVMEVFCTRQPPSRRSVSALT